MPRIRTDSFRFRIFAAILLVALVPAAVAVAGGTFTLRSLGTGSGTLGAWDSVAESGRSLFDALDAAGIDDPQVRSAAESHRRALSESVRWSNLYAFVAGRFVQVLPAAAVLATILVTGLALFTADRLARAFAGPVAELVGWTERIARSEPLPEPARADDAGVRELRVLRDALRDMAAQLEEGRRRAVEAARLRSWSDLARRVAHELKNPLTPMKMAATALARGGGATPADVGRILLEEIDRLDMLARTFAQYGRLPEGPRSDVDVVELLESVAALHREEEGVEIVVEASGPAVVHGHLDALRRALENLVSNAVEAQEDAPVAHVELRVTSADEGVVVEVSDRGPGVPDALLSEIWNPDVTTKRRGTGLGLAIVHQIVGVHRGSVEALNRPGGGATFRVTLPHTDPSEA